MFNSVTIKRVTNLNLIIMAIVIVTEGDRTFFEIGSSYIYICIYDAYCT